MKKIFIFICIITLAAFTSLNAQYSTGMSYDDESYEATPMKAPLVRAMYSGTSIPASASLKNYSPYPKTQGSYSTCVGWASAYAAMTITTAMKNGWTDRTSITDNAFSPGYLYNKIKSSDDYNCAFGSYINEALDILKTNGAPKYNDFSESCPSSIPGDMDTKAKQNTIKDFAKIFDLTDYNNFKIQAMKKSLAENKPVVIGMKIPNSFYNATGVWIPTEDPNGDFGGHAMCVIGYDDNMQGGVFEIQNSWGDGWGNSGYIWMKYQDFANFTKYAFELIDEAKVSPTGESEFSGKVKLLLSNGSDMKASLKTNKYVMNQSYKSGTKFRLYISNNEPAFVYAFGSDETKKIFQIFPHKPNISPALTYTNNDVAIPDEDHYIEMDNTVGTDYLCVLYSANTLDIKKIQADVEAIPSGTFAEKVQKVLGTSMVPFEKVTYSANEIGFSAKSKDQSVVALIVETKHVQ